MWTSLRVAAAPAARRMPLEGVRVLDLSRVLAGPVCTQIMHDLGAEVIKVERPHRGDDSRQWGPPFVQQERRQDRQERKERGHDTNDEPTYHRTSAYYTMMNRGKKSIGIDLKQEQGVQVVRRIAQECDIVVENFLPGTLARYHLDYGALSKVNKDIIYASISGYGWDEPGGKPPKDPKSKSRQPGYDYALQGTVMTEWWMRSSSIVARETEAA